MSEELNVVSLFNGMNTGRQALENQGFKVGKYYSSEIKPYAIELTQFHFPDTIQVGNILNWREWDIDWARINLVLSGSPCQDLSIAGKRKGITGTKSSLFYIFIEILEHIKSLNPNVIFFQENVGSASKKDVGIISRQLGVYPVRIDSKLVVAQQRDRYYWTNIRTKETLYDLVVDIPQPKDRMIMLKDIIEHGYVDRDKSRAILESEERIHTNMDLMYKRYKSTGFGNIVFLEDNKVKVKVNTKVGVDILTENDCLDLSFPTSTTRRGRVTKGKSPCLMESNNCLYVLQINPSTESGGKQPFMQNRVYSDQGKNTCLTESQAHNSKVAFEYKGEFKIRPLTKIELCRLQGFPDNYCEILSRKKAASLLGDGWTLPIIEHIFSFMHPTKNLILT